MQRTIPLAIAIALVAIYLNWPKQPTPIQQQVSVAEAGITKSISVPETSVVLPIAELDWSDARYSRPDGSYDLVAIVDEKIRRRDLQPEERREYLQFLTEAERSARNTREEVLEVR